MGLFDFLKKSAAPKATAQVAGPYQEASANLIYELLFCDDLLLYKQATQEPYTYPFDVLFSETTSRPDLHRVSEDEGVDTRCNILAYNRLLALGHKPLQKDLLAVIVEVGLEGGLDVLASFRDGTARYINQTGKIIIWETKDETSKQLTEDLFLKSGAVVEQIGPWDRARLRYPKTGHTRISFLVSDGLYFGEAETNVLFNDELASPALRAATSLMQYITEKSLQANQKR